MFAKRSLGTSSRLLLLGIDLLFVATVAAAGTETSPLLGVWSGQVHYGGESKMMSLRFEQESEQQAIMFFELPAMKFRNFGPIRLQQQGAEYKAWWCNFHLAADRESLSGVWSFDGHELPFELKRGALTTTPSERPHHASVASRPAWTFKTGGPIWSSPVVSQNTVYFGSNDGTIYALKAASGKLLWQFKTGGAVRRDQQQVENFFLLPQMMAISTS